MAVNNENIKKIENLIKNLSGQIIISIDGPCGSGKSTISKEINDALGFNIVHMDDFYLPFDKRDKNWVNEIAGNMDFDRLIDKVIIPYKENRKAEYISYDVHSDKYLKEIPIDLNKILVIEGSYSTHPRLSKYTDIKIFIDIDKDEQIVRLTKRNPKVVDKFLSMWVPYENIYFEKMDIKNNCDLVLTV